MRQRWSPRLLLQGPQLRRAARQVQGLVRRRRIYGEWHVSLIAPRQTKFVWLLTGIRLVLLVLVEGRPPGQQ
jgi:hypothetical protein